MSIGSTVEFLDVLVENNYGQLKTSVFHKPAAEPYILPILSDHPRHAHRNTIKGQLVRAARLCSHVEDFDKERLKIEFTLLLNGYPPIFIGYHLTKFFRQNAISILMEELDQVTYQSFSRNLVKQPTRKKNQQQQQQQKESTMTQDQNRNYKNIRVYYTFENGPMLKFQGGLQCLSRKHYRDNHPIMKNVDLTIGTRSNKNLNQLLVRKKTAKPMLINVTDDNATTT